MFFVWSSGGRGGGGGMMAGGHRPRLHLHLIGLCLYLLQMIDLDSLLFSSSSSNNNRRSPPAAILRELELPTLAMFAPLVVVPMALLCARLWTSGGPAVAVHREGFRRRLDDLERSVADVGWMTLSAGAALLSLAVGAVLGFTVRLWSVSSVLSVVTNVVGIYVATMSLVDFWREGPTPGGAGGGAPPPRRERPGGFGGFWRGDHPWWRYPGGDGGGGRTTGGGRETESPLSHIVGIVQGMPIEEYVPDDELPDCTVKQLRRMIELRRARHVTGDDGASTAVEKVELVEAARRCRNYDDDGGGPCCIICQEDYERGDPLRILPRCGHEFHVECIDRWAYAFASKRDSTPGGAWGSRSSSRPREPSCPLCKTALKE